MVARVSRNAAAFQFGGEAMKPIVIVLMQGARCRNADPSLFDAIEGAAAKEALAYCLHCPVKRECEAFIKPKKSFFDGVCGGKVWANGRHINLAIDDWYDDRIMR